MICNRCKKEFEQEIKKLVTCNNCREYKKKYTRRKISREYKNYITNLYKEIQIKKLND